MKNKVVTIQELVNHFGLVWVCGDRESMYREIKEVAVNRPGIELAGFFDYVKSKRLILIGNKETTFIKTRTKEQIQESCEFLMSAECPGMVICGDNDVHPYMLEIAKSKNFPIFKSTRKTKELDVEFISYLSEKLAPSTSIHGTLVEIFSTGVVIMGESGIGKSETALELIKKGHQLISDDRVDITYVHNHLVGRAPELLYNMIEVRGIGIIDVTKMFGVNAIVDFKEIDLIIKLVTLDADHVFERLGSTSVSTEILGQSIPVITIPVNGARAIGEIIEVAVTNFKLKRAGYDSTYQFEERMNELLKRGE